MRWLSWIYDTYVELSGPTATEVTLGLSWVTVTFGWGAGELRCDTVTFGWGPGGFCCVTIMGLGLGFSDFGVVVGGGDGF